MYTHTHSVWKTTDSGKDELRTYAVFVCVYI